MPSLGYATSAGLTAKLGACVLCGAISAIGLLASRQERVHAASELSDSIQRRAEADRALWELRLEIARRTSPGALQAVIGDDANEIIRDWCPPVYRLANDERPALATGAGEP